MSHVTQSITGIINKLLNESGLISQLATYEGDPAVFAHVPQSMNEHPYVVLYDFDLSPDDTMITNYFDGTFSIHSWSDQPDLAIIGDIQKSVYDALHKKDLIMSNYYTTDMHQEFETILRDPDGITIHGVQRFRLIIQTEI